MEPFKNIYNLPFYQAFTEQVELAIPNFNSRRFIAQIFDEAWEARELKARMRHTTEVLHDHLSSDYGESVFQIRKIIQQLKQSEIREKSLEFMFFPDFIEHYGLEFYEISVPALKDITSFTSCEFAVRPFIIKYPERMLKDMLDWADNENLHIRRLASEGSRSRLPWAMAIPFLKKNPDPVLPILEQLKNDESEYVRRSVANNLNDISKDNPNLVIQIAKAWYGQSKDTNWVVKHASRTLLKAGNAELMPLFGFGSIDSITIKNFKLKTPNIKVGEALIFGFDLLNKSNQAVKIRLEYAVYYQKANGSLSKKVYKISEKDYASQSATTIERAQSFKLITTRKFHSGLHQVALVINGNEFEKHDFMLQI